MPLEWRDPPPRSQAVENRRLIVEQLKEYPGRWAYTATVRNHREGNRERIYFNRIEPNVQVAVRHVGDDEYEVYVRYRQ